MPNTTPVFTSSSTDLFHLGEAWFLYRGPCLNLRFAFNSASVVLSDFQLDRETFLPPAICGYIVIILSGSKCSSSYLLYVTHPAKTSVLLRVSTYCYKMYALRAMIFPAPSIFVFAKQSYSLLLGDVGAIVELIDLEGIPYPSLALLTFVSGLLENLCLILAFRTAKTSSTLSPTFNMIKAVDTADRSQKHRYCKPCVFKSCSKDPLLLPYRTTAAAASFDD